MLNQILLIGNAGGDAELKHTDDGRKVCEFSMAVSRSRLVEGEWQTISTEWFRVSHWGDPGQRTADSVRKGNRVFVDGRLSANPYRTESGELRAGLQVAAFKVLNLSAGESVDAAAAPAVAKSESSDIAEGIESGESLPW